MSKFSRVDQDIISSYHNKVRPNLHETVNGDKIDLNKIMEAIQLHMAHKNKIVISL